MTDKPIDLYLPGGARVDGNDDRYCGEDACVYFQVKPVGAFCTLGCKRGIGHIIGVWGPPHDLKYVRLSLEQGGEDETA